MSFGGRAHEAHSMDLQQQCNKGTYICDVLWALARFVLFEQLLGRGPKQRGVRTKQNQLRHGNTKLRGSVGVPRVVELLEPVLEDLFLLVLLDEGVAAPQPVELVDHPFEELVHRASEQGDMDMEGAQRYDALKQRWYGWRA